MQNAPDGYRLVVGAAARALRPREKLSVSEWAGKYRKLPRGKSSEAGKWDPDRVPFLNGIMAALEDLHPAQLVVFIKSAQTGGSEAALNWIGRNMHQSPTAMFCLFPGEKEAGKWARGKLNPMIRSTKELRAIIPLGRGNVRAPDADAADESQRSIKEIHFPGGTLYTGSGNIANDLAQITVQYVIIDDADRIPLELKGEGDPGELVKLRAATHPLRKTLEISTPTDEETSRVWLDWLQSTQDHYHVPCPLCGERQVLSFDNLRWPDGQPKLVVYQCEHCEGSIQEARHKTDMLHDGEWRPEHPERETEVKGFHANGLMTPVGLGFTWAEHAEAWDRAKGKPSKVRVYYNTRRGEVFKSEKVKLEWQSLATRREPYPLRTIPAGVLVLTAGVDFQHDRVEAGIIGWGRNERATVIDHVIKYGDPTRDEIFTWLDDYLAGEMLNAYGVKMRLAASALDSGNWQHEVLNFTRTRRQRNIFATKGSSIRTRMPIGKPSLVDVNYRGVSQKRGAEQYQIGVSMIKTWLYQRLNADAGTPDAPVTPAGRHVRFSVDLSDEYFRQLAAERYDEKDGWVKTYDHNESLDIFVMARAAALHHSVAIHRYRELDWQRLEQLYEPSGETPKPAESTLGKVAIPARSGGFLPTSAQVHNS